MFNLVSPIRTKSKKTMSDRQDYDACYNAFMAIPGEEVKAPDMPVDATIQKNENLYFWCLDDKPGLIWVQACPKQPSIR